MHRLKTGALIRASVLMGAVAAGLQDQQQLQSLGHYADQIGLAFQIRDDILDCIADTETLGKQQGADIELDKPTYVSALGLEGAQQKLAEVHASAISALLQSHPNAEQSMLKQVADYICDRKY